MIALNIATPAHAPIQRVNLLRLLPPAIAQEQYCGIARAQERETFACVVIHPYRAAHLYTPVFPALFPLLLAEVWPARQMAEITWVDITYMRPASSRPQLLVRSTPVESATAEIVWQDRDSTYARRWESRAWPVIDLLERIKK